MSIERSSRRARRFRGIAAAALLACVAVPACDDEPDPIDPGDDDPFVLAETFPLDAPGRAFAIVEDAPPIALVASEFHSDIAGISLKPGSLASLFELEAPKGPRAICASSRDVLVAGTSSASVVRYELEDGDLVERETVEVDGPPTAVACADADGDGVTDFAAAVGFEEEATIIPFGSGSLAPGDGVPFASASSLRFADVDDDGDLDLVALATAQTSLAIVVREGAGYGESTTLDLPCEAPRATAAMGSATIAVACDGEILLVENPISDAPTVTSIEAQPALYDVVADDFDGDGNLDLAAVGIIEHELEVWMGPTAQLQHYEYPVARGPIALAISRSQSNEDSALIVLSFEQARLSVFEH
ncbi:MAG: VCBS repeat-containing protein [Polyangiaceae bacterium]|nr:VCBS repeat-containing protein [Polyangiaceae bacterium]